MLFALEILETGDQACPPVAAGESRACSRKLGWHFWERLVLNCLEEFSNVGSLFWKFSFILQEYWNLKEIGLCISSFSH